MSESHFQDMLNKNTAEETCKSCGFKPTEKTKNHECLQKKMHNLELNSVMNEEELETILKERLEKNRMDVSLCCPLCSISLGSFDQVWSHLQGLHGLYIPDQQYLIDSQGLAQYLADKMAVGYCLYCGDGKAPFASVESLRQHMLDKGHVKIRFDETGSEELADFYNWDSLFEDADGEDALLTPDGTELVLPSSLKRLGNREYYKYYKQYLRPYHLDEAEQERRKEQARAQQLIRMKGQDGRIALTLRQYTRVEKRHQHEECTHNLKQDLSLGSKANKNNQQHFRLQIR